MSTASSNASKQETDSSVNVTMSKRWKELWDTDNKD